MSIVLVAFVATVIAAPIVAAAMTSRGVLDLPNERSSHIAPIPRGGGIAGLVAVALVAVLAVPLGYLDALPALGVAAGLGLVGLADDVASLPPAPRFAAQVVAGLLAGAWAGGVLGALVGMVLMPAVVNMVNFMDGINGISGGHAALWGLTAFAAGAAADLGPLLVVGGLCAGIGLGFLPWNLVKTRLFLGDVGSYLLGGLIGSGLLAVLFAWARGDVPVSHAAATGGALLLYFADTSVALVRRALRGERLTQAHREHVYQLLANQGGYSHAAVSLAMVTAGAVVVGALWSSWPIGLVVGAIVALVYLLSPRLFRVDMGVPTR